MNDPIIEDGIPFPTKSRANGITATILKMTVGQSAFFEDKSPSTFSGMARHWRLKYGISIVTRTEKKGDVKGVRVWILSIEPKSP